VYTACVLRGALHFFAKILHYLSKEKEKEKGNILSVWVVLQNS
jgi:hypothetical protein